MSSACGRGLSDILFGCSDAIVYHLILWVLEESQRGVDGCFVV